MALLKSWLPRFVAESPNSFRNKTGRTSVEISCGVPKLEQKGGESYLVSSLMENDKYPKSGYFHAQHQQEVLEILKAAEEKDIPVVMRFEREYREDSPEDAKIEDYQDGGRYYKERTRHIAKVLAAIYNPAKKEWLRLQIISEPEDDPPEVAEFLNRVLEGDQSVDINEDDFLATPKVKENFQPALPRSWEMDKIYVIHALYFFVKLIEKRYEYELSEEQRRKLTLGLLNLSNAIQQMLVPNLISPNYRDYSHTKARHILFNSEEFVHPLTEDETKDIKGWVKKVFETSKDLVEWSLEVGFDNE